MLNVSPGFKTTMTAPIKRVGGYIVLQDGTEVTAGGDLQKYTISSTGNYLKTAMSELKATLLGQRPDLIGTTVDVYYGTFHTNAWDYVLKGKFNITEAAYKKGENTTELTGYDNMLLFTVDYSSVGDYPTTLYNYLAAVCAGAGVVLANTSIYNGSIAVADDYYKNIEDFTFRDVLEDICELAASYALINPDGKLELRQISDSGEILTYDNLITYDTGDLYGGINSLVLSRQPQNDDVYVQDEADISRPMNRNIMDLNKFNVTYSSEEA